MKTLATGFIIICSVFAFLLKDLEGRIFYNLHSVIIVFVGCFSILLFSNPAESLVALWESLRFLVKKPHSSEEIISQILLLEKKKAHSLGWSHPLVRRFRELREEGLGADIIQSLLEERAETIDQHFDVSVNILRNLSKYPPALGMTGTVIGLVNLFAHLTPEGKASVGPSLAVAMTATFYGLILANFVLMPISDRIAIIQLEQQKLNDRIIQALRLTLQNESASLLQEGSHDAAA